MDYCFDMNRLFCASRGSLTQNKRFILKLCVCSSIYLYKGTYLYDNRARSIDSYIVVYAIHKCREFLDTLSNFSIKRKRGSICERESNLCKEFNKNNFYLRWT